MKKGSKKGIWHCTKCKQEVDKANLITTSIKHFGSGHFCFVCWSEYKLSRPRIAFTRTQGHKEIRNSILANKLVKSWRLK
jgi:hypothetical protein